MVLQKPCKTPRRKESFGLIEHIKSSLKTSRYASQKAGEANDIFVMVIDLFRRGKLPKDGSNRRIFFVLLHQHGPAPERGLYYGLVLAFIVLYPIDFKKKKKTVNMAFGKAGDTRDFASEKAGSKWLLILKLVMPGKQYRGHMEEDNQKWNIAKDKVSHGANNIEDTMCGAFGYGKDKFKVANAYGVASQK